MFLAEGQDLLTCRAEARHRGVGVGERHLEQRPLNGQRGAQLMRCVGDKPSLRLKRRLQPCQKIVQRVAQALELVIGSGEREPAARFPAEMVRAVSVI